MIREETNTAMEQAREFLREVLKDGPVPVDDLLAAAKHAGVTHRTLKRAKAKEKVQARRVPCDDVPSNKWPWEWTYPTRTPDTP